MLRVALYIDLATVGHFLWEAVQLPLYTLWRTGTPREVVIALIHCTGGDILITTVTLAAAGALAWHCRWGAFGWRMIFTAIVLGITYTNLSEWLNVQILRRWSYIAAMPVVPLLGTGLTPLLQWLIVPGMAFASISRPPPPPASAVTLGPGFTLKAPCAMRELKFQTLLGDMCSQR